MKKNLLSIMAAGITTLLAFTHSSFASNDRTVVHQMLAGTFKTDLRNVMVNGVRLNDEFIISLEHTYNVHIQDGSYWYDNKCGAWGKMGGPTLGFTWAGLDLGGGTMKENASNGTTGVFVNGRQLHWQEVSELQQLGQVYRMRYWVDGLGNFGFEGVMMQGNLWVIVQQRMASGVRGNGAWAVYSGQGGLVTGNGKGENYAQFPGGVVW